MHKKEAIKPSEQLFLTSQFKLTESKQTGASQMG